MGYGYLCISFDWHLYFSWAQWVEQLGFSASCHPSSIYPRTWFRVGIESFPWLNGLHSCKWTQGRPKWSQWVAQPLLSIPLGYKLTCAVPNRCHRFLHLWSSGCLRSSQNSLGLSSDGKFFFTVIALVGLLVGKNHKTPLWGGKKSPPVMTTGLHVQFYFPREWELMLSTSLWAML